MRRIRYSVAMSLDAYIAGPNGESDWIIMDPEIDFGELFDSFDTVLMGRRTFEVAMAQGGGGPMPGMKTIVVSRTLRPQDHPGITIVADRVEETLARLRAEPGKDIWLFGGGSLFRSLLDARLVDTVEVAVIPVLLGGGMPLLPPPAETGQAEIDRQQGVQDGHHVAGVRRRAGRPAHEGAGVKSRGLRFDRRLGPLFTRRGACHEESAGTDRRDFGRARQCASIDSGGGQPAAPAEAEHAQQARAQQDQAARLGGRDRSDLLGDDGVACRSRVDVEGVPGSRYTCNRPHAPRTACRCRHRRPRTPAASPSMTLLSSEMATPASPARGCPGTAG